MEKLKIKIKDAFRPDWKNCIWYRDEQSEQLCSKLYPSIFDTENRIRGFVNKVLIGKIGADRLESPSLEKYRDGCMERAKDFRDNVLSFSYVDDALISATLEMLFQMIKEGQIFEKEYALSWAEFHKVI